MVVVEEGVGGEGGREGGGGGREFSLYENHALS